MHNDLSNADLIFCEGLSNLKDIKDINFDNAHIRSEIMDKLGLKYEILNNSKYCDKQTRILFSVCFTLNIPLNVFRLALEEALK